MEIIYDYFYIKSGFFYLSNYDNIIICFMEIIYDYFYIKSGFFYLKNAKCKSYKTTIVLDIFDLFYETF